MVHDLLKIFVRLILLTNQSSATLTFAQKDQSHLPDLSRSQVNANLIYKEQMEPKNFTKLKQYADITMTLIFIAHGHREIQSFCFLLVRHLHISNKFQVLV